MDNSDTDVPGPSRDYVGYGRRAPRVFWPDGANVAVNLGINQEEGSEYSYTAGDGRNDTFGEIPFTLPAPYRDLHVESVFEYGSRAGVWRLARSIRASVSGQPQDPILAGIGTSRTNGHLHRFRARNRLHDLSHRVEDKRSHVSGQRCLRIEKSFNRQVVVHGQPIPLRDTRVGIDSEPELLIDAFDVLIDAGKLRHRR